MKSYLPLLAIAAFLASCSSAYRSGQTPDDVYFSPERPQDEYVRVEKRNDNRRYNDDELDREDRYLRMKVANRRYGLLDEYDLYAYNGNNYYRYNDYYRYNNYNYYSRNWGMWNNGYTYWNYNPYYYNPYHYSPYYSGVVYGNINPKYNKPRSSNLHIFDRNGNSESPYAPKSNGRTFSSSRSDDNYRGSGSNAGGFLRDAFGGSNNNSSSGAGKTSVGSSNNNSSSSGSSSSGSSSSGSSRAPVRKF
ncbi:MAG: hypothetical protein M3Q06_00165 [Bacteroidota bacterium]|nr:hypothetical protein [Bacteroidota bacterium]